MENKWFTVYFVNLTAECIFADHVAACDAYTARRSFMRRIHDYLLEPGQRYRVDVCIGQRPLLDFPSWMFDPDRVYQTAR